jgi:hypothetical protein
LFGYWKIMGYGTKKFIYFSYLRCNELKEYAFDEAFCSCSGAFTAKEEESA